MNFFINEFSIIAPAKNKAFNEKFKKKINLIIGEKDSGKSSLARSILYALGCDVKSWDFISKMPENIYIINFSIDENKYILIRKKLKNGKGKNFFKVIKNESQIKCFYDTKEFKEYFNRIMSIEVNTINKNNQVTKLYPNHIFLPFYTDQDYSWQSYLSSTFNGINFINDYKKIVLEYFTGARSNEYYKLQLEKKTLKNLIINTEAVIKSKKLIVEENYKNIHIIENINIESFQKQYKHVLEMYSNIIETEHKLKKELNEKIYKKNSLLEMKIKLDSSIEEIIDNELDNHCPNCKQIINKDMEENYILLLTQQNLIKEREKISMYLKDLEKEISESMSDIENVKNKNIEVTNKLNSDAKIIELADRANSYALNGINEKLLSEISELTIKIGVFEEDFKKIEKQLSDLNQIDVAEDYRRHMIKAFEDLKIPFSYKNYYVSNLESVKINLSGATKVQAYIAQYLSIYQMSVKSKSTINIPMFIDTFLKDDFNLEETNRTSQYIFNNLKDNFQSFIFMSNNEQTINAISSYDYNEINLTVEDKLLNKDYNLIYNKYANLLK